MDFQQPSEQPINQIPEPSIQQNPPQKWGFWNWGFWIGFVIGFVFFLLLPIHPLGCYNKIPGHDGVYFGVETFSVLGSGDCFNVVSRAHKYCSIAEYRNDPNNSYKTRLYPNFNFSDCLKNPNNYPFNTVHYEGGDEKNFAITPDNIDGEFMSSYAGGQTLNVLFILMFFIPKLFLAFIPGAICSLIARVVHSLFNKKI